MSLHAARMHVLKLLDVWSDQRIPVSPELPGQVRRALCQLEASDNVQAQREAMDALERLSRTDGVSLFSSLLQCSFLLHKAFGIRQTFASLFAGLPPLLEGNEPVRDAFVTELARYSESPYETTRELVKLAIAELARVPNVLGDLLRNGRTPFRLRYFVAEHVVAVRDEPSYRGVVSLYAELSKKDAQHFFTYALPLLREYVKAGEPAFAAAMKELGVEHAQMPKVCQEFGDVFHKWFRRQSPPASEPWARVLLRAWRSARSLDDRDYMLNHVVDEYCRVPELASAVRADLRNMVAENPRLLATCSAQVQDKVERFIGQNMQDVEALSRDLVNAAADEATWKTADIARGLRERWQGKAVALALRAANTPESRDRLLSIVHKGDRMRLLNGFFQWVSHPASFFELPADIQLRLCNLSMGRHVTAAHIAALLEEVHDVEVHKALEKIRDELASVMAGEDDGAAVGRL